MGNSYSVYGTVVRHEYDVYGTVLIPGDIYFYTVDERVSLCNICRYLDERHNDQYASEIDNDAVLIEYVERNYFYDTLRYDYPIYVERLI